MQRRLYKIILILGIVFILISIPIFWFNYESSKNLEIDFLDVGQGDSILIKTPMGQNILIDGGQDISVIEGLSENLSWWDRKIDLMILTHPHDDHVTGLIDVIKRYEVKKIIYTGVIYSSPNYLEWLEAVQKRKISLVIIDRPQKIIFGDDCCLDVLYPLESLLGKEVSNLNNSSIVSRLVYKKTSFLLTGDAEEEIEKELLSKNINLKADLFKAGHHGSDTSNSEDFLEAVNPRIAVIQVGEDNDFGHPSLRVLKRFERGMVEVYRNDKDGTIKIISDGEEIWRE